jgi:hypothetical protein
MQVTEPSQVAEVLVRSCVLMDKGGHDNDLFLSAITVERVYSILPLFLSLHMHLRAATEPAGEQMHLRASLSLTVIQSSYGVVHFSCMMIVFR